MWKLIKLLSFFKNSSSKRSSTLMVLCLHESFGDDSDTLGNVKEVYVDPREQGGSGATCNLVARIATSLIVFIR